MDISGDDKNEVPINANSIVKIVDDEQLPEGDSDSGDKPTNLAIEYDVEAADPENTHALRITMGVEPTENGEEATESESSRLVPAACAICLCPYETGDEVTWSPRKECQHAFHSECIVPWLAKTDEPKCPCCRQDYCDPVPMSQLEQHHHNPMSLFAATGSFANLGVGSDGDGDLVIPHFMRTLEASRLEFLNSLELATVEASARTRRDSHTSASPATALGTAGRPSFETGSSFENGSPFEIHTPLDDGVELREINSNQNSTNLHDGDSLEVANGNGEATVEAASTNDDINSEGEATQPQQSSPTSPQPQQL